MGRALSARASMPVLRLTAENRKRLHQIQQQQQQRLSELEEEGSTKSEEEDDYSQLGAFPGLGMFKKSFRRVSH